MMEFVRFEELCSAYLPCKFTEVGLNKPNKMIFHAKAVARNC